jgi:hypothetical protein
MIIAFLLPRIALSNKGLSVAIVRGKRNMNVKEEDQKNEVESGMQCLMAQPHVRNIVSIVLYRV